MNGATALPFVSTMSPPSSTIMTRIGRSQNFFRTLMNDQSSATNDITTLQGPPAQNDMHVSGPPLRTVYGAGEPISMQSRPLDGHPAACDGRLNNDKTMSPEANPV